jgi:hypothetical protein
VVTLTVQASSQFEESSAEHGPGAMLQDLQQQQSELGVKYTLVSHYVVSEATFPDGETMYTVRQVLEQSALLGDWTASEVLGVPPDKPLSTDVHPNAESWNEIFEKTSYDHWPSTWGETSLPLQRFRLSFGDSSPDFENIHVITRSQAADTASEKSADGDHSSLTLSEHGYKRRSGQESPSRPLVTKYEWQPATSPDLERLANLWETRDKSHVIKPKYL